MCPDNQAGTPARDFPHYLGSDELPIEHLAEAEPNRQWFGGRLRELRGERSFSEVMRGIREASRMPVGELAKLERQLEKIEAGVLALPLGSLYDVVEFGYGIQMSDILGELFEARRSRLDPDDDRPFEREHFYSYIRKEKHNKKVTPALMGGDGVRYVWATPLRRLKGSPMLTEYLELAPHAVNERGGKIPVHSHQGAELIFVVHGTVSIYLKTVETGSGAEGSRPIMRDSVVTLSQGSCLHFLSRATHLIENALPATKALLHITRVLKI